jgi:serine/threonine protein kinase
MRHANTEYESAVLAMAVIPEHELLRPIASGAYGQVWLARSRLGVFRAVKIVHRASFEHERPFEREFAGIKAFEPVSRSHEGLVDLLQVGRDDRAGYFYYVMELADDVANPKSEGRSPKSESAAATDISRHLAFEYCDLESYVPRTLAAELKSRGRLPLEECIQLGLSLTQALAYLHGQGLVHRDVKPSNVIFVRGVPKLADVGLVTVVGEARSFVGTEGFIPPEGPGTPQADVYSLGIVLYVLSTGKSHQDFPEPPTDVGAQANHSHWLEFDAVVHKACQADIRERFQSAEQMRDELLLLEAGKSVRRQRTEQRRWTLAQRVSLVAMAVALMLGGWSFLKGKSVHTPDPETARLYELGQWYYTQLTPTAHKKALEVLTQAVHRDPKFVQPYGEMMALYTWLMLPGITNDQIRFQKVKEIADRALAIDANAAERHTALSLCRFLERNWRGAEEEIRRAIQLNPNHAIAHYLYSYYLTLQLRTEEARREGQRAEELEPPAADRVAAVVAAWPYMAERRFDLAIAQLRRVLDLDRNVPGYGFLAKCYEAQSNYLAALDTWNAADLLAGDDPPATLNAAYAAVRRAYAEGGEQAEQAYYHKWISLTLGEEANLDTKGMFPERDLAGYYARLGENAKALDEIEKHFDEPNFWPQIKFEPLYDSLHDEPRYKALVKRAGLEN